MGKQTKKRTTAKIKNVRPNTATPGAGPIHANTVPHYDQGTKKSDVGLTDKLSRIFYSWMRKKMKTSVAINLKVENFEIKGLICEGTFGKVMLGVNMNSKLTAAVKIEPIDTDIPQLQSEFKIYEKLGHYKTGFIKVYHYGPCDKGYYNALVMELLGPDLDDLFVACNAHFSYKTVLMIAIQTLQLMQHVHSKQIIYRDVKPENFCIGHKYHNKEKDIYIIDFGLSKMFDTVATKNEDVLYEYLIGTARYMSINAHYGKNQSQRDDLESLGYMYMYFLKNRLPWIGLSRTDNIEEQCKVIAVLKASTPVENILKDFPPFIEYMKYVKNLEHMETPNYAYMINLMKNAMKSNNFTNDSTFDWTAMMNQKYLNKALTIDPDD